MSAAAAGSATYSHPLAGRRCGACRLTDDAGVNADGVDVSQAAPTSATMSSTIT
jgi:hypothetical protein